MVNATTMIALPLVGAVFIFACAKGLKYALTIQSERYDSGVKNILLMLLNGYMIGLILMATGWISGYLSGLGVPHLSGEVWGEVPKPLVFGLTLLALDFTNYWNHRILHSRFMWGIHAIHHSDAHINWTTSYRIHVLEWVLMTVGFLLVMGWMSLPAWALASAGFIHGVYNKYVHCQTGWTHGWLKNWLISPNFHRWHHADDPAAYNRNYGDMFAIWDRLFGTHYDGGRCETKLGLADGPQSLPEMIIYPFKYWWAEYYPRKG